MQTDYLGMSLSISDLDSDNQDYFRFAAAHDFRLQQCGSCNLLRYPPASRCVWCSEPRSTWVSVPGTGTVYSYGEVHHAIQPPFQAFVPYLLLLVELDVQREQPSHGDAIRVVGNLVTSDGTLAPADLVRKVGIGSRMRMVFTDIGPELSLPQWTIDETGPAHSPWRYPNG